MSSWNDFNDAESQSFDLIPKGTIAKVRLTIRPGGYNDEQQGWTGGYATRNANTGAVYLNCEYTVARGQVRAAQGLQPDRADEPEGPGVGQHGPEPGARDLLQRRRPDPDRRADRRRQPGPPAHLRDRRRRPVGARQGQAQGRRLRHGGGRRDHEPHADHRPGHPSLAGQGRRSPDRGVLLDGRSRHGRRMPASSRPACARCWSPATWARPSAVPRSRPTPRAKPRWSSTSRC